MDVVHLDLSMHDVPVLAADRWVHLVVWHRELYLGDINLSPVDRPATDDGLREAALAASLPALWGHLFAPNAEFRLPPPRAAASEVLAIASPFEVLHGRLAPRADAGADVSVLVCTRDRPDDLRRCLASLGSLRHRPAEIIVVDNASTTAETEAVVAAHPDVSYVREDRPGLDVARNTAVEAASRDIIVFTDDDVIVDPGWVGQLRLAFDDTTAAVTGQVLPVELETAAQVVFEQQWGLGKGAVPRTFGPGFHARLRRRGTPVWAIGAGANMAFRRSVVEEVGRFDHRLDVGAAGCSGDSELWYRLLTAGHRIRYAPTAVVHHRHRRSDREFRDQIRAYMRGHTAALLVQHERTGDLGNLARLGLVLPRDWVRTAAAWATGALHCKRVTLRDEVIGSIQGVQYFRSHR